MARVSVINGATCFLWQDLWADQLLEQAYPELHSYAKNKSITVRDACQSPVTHDLFHLPLSVEAFQQFQEFTSLLDSLHLLEDNDMWSYIWNSPTFSSQKAYAHLIGNREVHPAYSWLWKSCSQNKRKVLDDYNEGQD